MPIYHTGPFSSNVTSVCGRKDPSPTVLPSKVPTTTKGLQKEQAGVYGGGFCTDFVFVKPADTV